MGSQTDFCRYLLFFFTLLVELKSVIYNNKK